MLNDKISIVIPIYNTDKYLPKCINSVLNQTYKNLEIILVDDGSTDKSVEICDKYSLQDNRIHVIHQKNSGIAHARNTGIRIATGEYLSFIDSDDYIEADMYKTLLDKLYAYDADIVECDHFRANSEKINTNYNSGEILQFNNQQALEALFLGKLKDCVWSKLYKRDVVDGIEFPVGNICEDDPWTYKVFARSQKIVFIDLAKYYYLQREDSNSHSSIFFWEKLDRFYNSKERLEFIARDFPSLFNVAQKRFWLDLLNNYIKLEINKHWDKSKKTRNEIKKYIITNYNSFYSNPLINKKDRLRLKIFRANSMIACHLFSFYTKFKNWAKGWGKIRH